MPGRRNALDAPAAGRLTMAEIHPACCGACSSPRPVGPTSSPSCPATIPTAWSSTSRTRSPPTPRRRGRAPPGRRRARGRESVSWRCYVRVNCDPDRVVRDDIAEGSRRARRHRRAQDRDVREVDVGRSARRCATSARAPARRRRRGDRARRRRGARGPPAARGRRATSAPRTSSPTWAASAPRASTEVLYAAVARRARGRHRGRARARPGRHAGFADDDALPGRRRRGRALGYRGKLCIHPAQVPLAHEAFSPSPEEIDTAPPAPRRLRRRRRPGRGRLRGPDGRRAPRPPGPRRASRVLRPTAREPSVTAPDGPGGGLR